MEAKTCRFAPGEFCEIVNIAELMLSGHQHDADPAAIGAQAADRFMSLVEQVRQRRETTEVVDEASGGG